jgi:hypothetical protein
MRRHFSAKGREKIMMGKKSLTKRISLPLLLIMVLSLLPLPVLASGIDTIDVTHGKGLTAVGFSPAIEDYSVISDGASPPTYTYTITVPAGTEALTLAYTVVSYLSRISSSQAGGLDPPQITSSTITLADTQSVTVHSMTRPQQPAVYNRQATYVFNVVVAGGGTPAPSSDATISGGSLAGVTLAGTFAGGDAIANSSALTVTIPDASKTDAALALTPGDANSTVRYVRSATQPASDEAYAGIYASGSTTVTVADGDVIWLLATAQDGTTRLYYRLTVTVSPAPAPSSDYTIDADGILTAYTGSGTVIAIPSSVDGTAVTGLGSNLFKDRSTITSVTVPAGVQSIGASSFSGCTSLSAVTIETPSSLNTIGNNAFQNCSQLAGFVFPEGLTTIGNYAFTGTTLEEITLPSTIKKIGGGDTLYPFPATLKRVTLSEGIISITARAFSNCTSLKEVVLPEGLEKIGNSAFSDCTSLKEVVLPEGLTTIEYGAFTNTLLTELEFPSTIRTIGGSSDSGTYRIFPATLETVTFKDGPTSISSYAFKGSSGLKEVVLPNTLTSVDGSAFDGCAALADIALPGTLVSIGPNAFKGCRALADIALPGTLTTIGANAFTDCTALKEIALPDSLTSLGTGNAFSGCTSLEKVMFPDNPDFTSLPNSTFSGCTALKDIDLPGSITTIGNSVFSRTGITGAVVIGKNVTSMGSAFSNTAVTDLTVLGPVASLAGYYLENCNSLETLILPDTVKRTGATSGSSVFYVGDNLKNVVMPGTYTSASYLFKSSFTSTADFYCHEDNTVLISALTGKSLSIKYLAEDIDFSASNAGGAIYSNGELAPRHYRGMFYGLEYGEGVQVYDITVLDALLTAHENLYGEGAFAVGNQLAVNSSGYITRAFNTIGDWTFTLGDGEARSIDDAASTVLKTGDRLSFSCENVVQADTRLGSLSGTGTPALDTGGNLDGLGFTAGSLTTTGDSPVKTAFDPDVTEYNYYVNEETASVTFTLEMKVPEMAGQLLLTTSIGGYSEVRASGEKWENIEIPLSSGSTAVAFTVYHESGAAAASVYTLNIVRGTMRWTHEAGIMSLQALDIKGNKAHHTVMSPLFNPGDIRDSYSLLIYRGTQETAAVKIVVPDDRTVTFENGTLISGSHQITLDSEQETYKEYTATFTVGGTLPKLRVSGVNKDLAFALEYRTNDPDIFTPDRLIGYLPAAGQFVSETGFRYDGASPLQAYTHYLHFLSLGGLGGYAVYEYDDRIVNDPHNPYGIDFIIYGNAFEGGKVNEPASVEVSQDGTHWYYLAGQRHYELATLYKQTQLIDGSLADTMLLTGPTSYPANVFFGYADVMSCSVEPNAEKTWWVVGQPYNPYAANAVSANIGDMMDISWAVDSHGKPVYLDSIKYVRLQNVIDADLGATGEVSTEIGAIVRTDKYKAQGAVGITEAPGVLTINGKSFSELGLTPLSSLNGGQLTYYERDLQGLISTVNVTVDGADQDNIYVNDQHYTGEADYAGLLDGSYGRTVRVIVQNGNKEPRIYVVKCVNGGDPATSADLDSIVVNAGSVSLNQSGDSYTATVENSVQYVNFRVKALNSGATMKLDGTAISQDVATDTLPLSVGANTFTLTITSADGSNTQTYSIVITRKSAGTSTDAVTVTFRLIGSTLSGGDIDLGNGDYRGARYVTWIPTTTYTLARGSTMYDLFVQATSAAGLRSAGAGDNYVKTIYAPSVLGGYALSEMTNGQRSGWMYTVNGSHPNVGLQDYTLTNGIRVVWHYVNDYSYEVADWFDEPAYPKLGDGTYWNKWLEAADVAPTPGSGGAGGNDQKSGAEKTTTLAPKATATNGVATASVSTSDITAAIKDAKEKGSTTILIAPDITGQANKVSVDIPKSSLASIASETDASLTVETAVGSITIPSDALASIASQATGGTVTVSLERVDNTTLTPEQQEAVGDDPVYDINVISGGKNISAFGGESIAVSLPCTLKEGEDPEGVTVWYLNDAGELEQVACTYDPATGMATFTTNHLSYYVVSYSEYAAAIAPPPVPGQIFSDVTGIDWFYDSVTFAVYRGLMNGTSASTFSPNDPMNRAMLVTVLHRLEGSPVATGANSFTDVKESEWYTNAVTWASTNHITTGYGISLFGTDDPVTREQMATILHRYASYKHYDTTRAADLSSYTDSPEIGDWAQTAMQWANAEGLITGRTTTTLAPRGSATRAEVAAIIMRFVEGIVENAADSTGS